MKYRGKTNELFTKLLINIAIHSGVYKNERRINILDPVAGKGTTLFEALRLGHSAFGLEIAPDAVQEAVAFFRKYLENYKYKHSYSQQKISGENKSFSAQKHTFGVFESKEAKKVGDALEFVIAEGDSRYADKIFSKERFHAIVGDLPYGVRHGSVSEQKQSSLTRNPSELLAACIPAWVKCLRPGGSIVLAWNTFVLPRHEMERFFTENGLTVLKSPPYDAFAHRVDQAINRDIIAGIK